MSVSAKIIEKINECEKATNGEKKPFISLEYFPPRSEEGLNNLKKRMERQRTLIKPLFSDITWGAGGSTAGLTMRITKHMHETGHTTNMHLTCTNMEKDGDPKKAVYEALEECHSAGVRNIVALRGDPAVGDEEWKAAEGGFTCALDLVKYIREHFGNDFGISVAGYPEGHPNAISKIENDQTLTPTEQNRCCVIDGVTYACLDADYEKELDYLKQKIDAGADFIITQMFFDADTFIAFVNDCRRKGINCPIVPGLMCINNYGGFKKMTGFCKTRVPKELAAKMDTFKDTKDDPAVKQFGIEFGIQISKKLIDSGLVPGLHFYTLNLEFVVNGILNGLGLSNEVGENADADEKSMQAVGSAWARVGDTVKSDNNEVGVLKEVKENGDAIIELEGGQTITVAKGSYNKC